MTDQKYNLNDSLGYLTGVAHWKLHKKLISKFNMSGIDVTPDQWLILISLLNDGEMYQSQLAICHQKDRSGIKRLVDHLANKGLVNRLSSGTDTRTNIIKLTDKGNELVQVLNGLARESLAEALQGFSESEIILLKRLLNDLIKNAD